MDISHGIDSYLVSALPLSLNCEIVVHETTLARYLIYGQDWTDIYLTTAKISPLSPIPANVQLLSGPSQTIVQAVYARGIGGTMRFDVDDIQIPTAPPPKDSAATYSGPDKILYGTMRFTITYKYVLPFNSLKWLHDTIPTLNSANLPWGVVWVSRALYAIEFLEFRDTQGNLRPTF